MSRRSISNLTKGMIALSFVAMIAIIIHTIPPDMDMYLQFHPIACKYYPLAYLHSFREDCSGSFDITLPGGFVWPRSAYFQGLAYAIFYYPIFLLFPYWQSAIYMCAFMLLGTILFCARAMGISAWITLLVMGVNFFCLFNMIYDICTVALHTMVIFAAPFLVVAATKTTSRHAWIGLNLLLALLLFLCVEYKFSFVYYLPAAVIITWCCLPQCRALEKIAMSIRASWLGAIIFSGLFILLLTAKRNSGAPFWTLIGETRGRYPNYDNLSDYISHLGDLITRYLLDFINSAAIITTSGTWGLPRLKVLVPHLQYNQILLTAPFWLLTIACPLCFYRACAKDASLPRAAMYRQRVNGTLIAAFFTFLLIGLNQSTRHAAHLLPPMACLLAALAISIDYLYNTGRLKLSVVVIVLCVNQLAITIYTGNIASTIWMEEYKWDRFKALDYLRQPEIAGHMLIAHNSWGTYYIGSLYGPKQQLVVYTQDMSHEEADRLIKLAHNQGRYLAFLLSDPASEGFQYLKSKLPNIKKIYNLAPKNNSTWEIWAEFDPFEDMNKPNSRLTCAPDPLAALVEFPLFIRY